MAFHQNQNVFFGKISGAIVPPREMSENNETVCTKACHVESGSVILLKLLQRSHGRNTKGTAIIRKPRGAEEHRNQQYPAEQHQEKEPQYESLRRRSGG
ncbi:hypothetical protein TNCV_2131601 [Trichonephila clavipes]|nr:hypothetical protein TNCV_2131601 [Trichonephila clavipes]